MHISISYIYTIYYVIDFVVYIKLAKILQILYSYYYLLFLLNISIYGEARGLYNFNYNIMILKNINISYPSIIIVNHLKWKI